MYGTIKFKDKVQGFHQYKRFPGRISMTSSCLDSQLPFTSFRGQQLGCYKQLT